MGNKPWIGNDNNLVIRQYRDLLLGFLKNKFFIIFLSITIALGYGFTLTNFSYGVDDTAFGRYFNGTDFLATGRFTAYIIHKLFGIYDFVPFWQDFLAIIMLFLGVLFWCMLIKRIAGDSVGMAAYIAFAAVFISFPNINEIFIYMMAGFSIGLGFLLTGISLAVGYEVIFSKLHWKWLIISCVLMCFALSLYESFAPVYLCGTLMMVILKILFGNVEKKSFKHYAIITLKFFGILLVGIVIRYAIAAIIMFFYQISPSTYGNVQIKWGNGQVIAAQAINLMKQLCDLYVLQTYRLIYVLLFSASCVLLVAIGTYLSIKEKDCKLILLLVGIIISSFMLMVIQGGLTPLRANQSHMVIVAFTVWLLCAMAKSWRKPMILLMAACLVLIQTKDLSQWFHIDYMRYQQDRTTVISIGMEIEKLDEKKPVVFAGTPTTYYKNQKHNQTNGGSIIQWGVSAFGSDTELINFFYINGYSLVQSNNEQKASAKEIAKSMPAWPKEGSIKECSDIIIVNFGNIK